MMKGPEMMPTLAALPTGDIIAGILVLATVAAVTGLIVKGNREVRRLRNQGFSENQIPRMLQLRHRDRHDIPTDEDFRDLR